MSRFIHKEAAVSPKELSIVAGASVIVAIMVRIGRAAIGNPSKVIISISLIVPPPTGTAVIKRLATIATIQTCQILIEDPNK